MTEQDLLYELLDNMSDLENRIKSMLSDAALDEKTYDVLYSFGAAIYGTMDLNNRVFLKYLSEK